jgi:hypothetical protein
VCAGCAHQLDGILRIARFTEVGGTCLYANLWLCWLPGHHGWLVHPEIGNQVICLGEVLPKFSLLSDNRYHSSHHFRMAMQLHGSGVCRHCEA